MGLPEVLPKKSQIVPQLKDTEVEVPTDGTYSLKRRGEEEEVPTGLVKDRAVIEVVRTGDKGVVGGQSGVLEWYTIKTGVQKKKN